MSGTHRVHMPQMCGQADWVRSESISGEKPTGRPAAGKPTAAETVTRSTGALPQSTAEMNLK
jgi:hypothetical protein